MSSSPARARSRRFPAFAYEDRTICEIRSENHPADVLAWFPDRVVFVGGGPPVWETYAPFIRHWDITRLPYDGDADRWFDPAWLVASEKPGVTVPVLRALSDPSAAVPSSKELPLLAIWKPRS